jgi:hypothetical protein
MTAVCEYNSNVEFVNKVTTSAFSKYGSSHCGLTSHCALGWDCPQEY